jgi:centrosomal protein POC5
MQEGLKKAFMRGVCALNFEAMNILTPQGKDEHMNQLEQEMLKNLQQENINSQFAFQSYQQTPADD